MKRGGWIPLCKGLACYLPKGRAYTRFEAAFSLQLDYDQGNYVTVAGYSELWGWSRKKVRGFFELMGIAIAYTEDTRKKQNQKGQIRIQIRDRSGKEKKQIRLIDSKLLCDKRNRSKSKKGQIRDRSGTTTIDPNPDPKDYVPFREIISHLNESIGSAYRPTTKRTQRHISARWAEGYRLEDFKSVIDYKAPIWGADSKMREYLRPETLFGTKFEGYLQAARNSGSGQPESSPYQMIGDL